MKTYRSIIFYIKIINIQHNMASRLKLPKKHKWQLKLEAQIEQNKANEIARLQRNLYPGQHILTCSFCGQMGIYPISQIVITHVSARGSKIHPGQISC